MTVTALVPARCGSKAIHLKNIKPFFGKPLIFWVLKALDTAQQVDKIVVATDCDEIESCIDQFHLDKVRVYRRSAESAQDRSSTEEVLLEYLRKSDLANDDKLLLVQATSPFTRPEDFDRAISQFDQNEADSLLSCARIKRFLWNDDGAPINYNPRQRPRRQDFRGTLMENGAFYLSTKDSILQSENRLSGKIAIYEMQDYTQLELDEENDWLLGEILMERLHKLTINAESLKLFLADVDGVLTDAGMYYSEFGDELKKFNTYDGMGFKLLQQRGIKVGIVTKEDRQLNRRRAKKLELDFDYHGVNQKLPLVLDLCKELGISIKEVAYIGDDINDLELLSEVGIAACPDNAHPTVKRIPGIVKLKTCGGSGAVREFVESLLIK